MWDHVNWHCFKYRHVYDYFKEHNLPILPLIISECGIDGGVSGRPKEGWRKFGLSPRQYMEDWKWYDAGLRQDRYVVGCCVYDCGSTAGMGWLSFNMDPEMLPLWARYAQEQGVTYWEPKEEEKMVKPIRVEIHEDARDPRSPILGLRTMEMEEYLRGVVAQEMPPSWPLEALKAQAVAARCYAERARAAPRHAERGADLCNTICCQAWLPLHFESTDDAVRATQNLHAFYDGQLVNAFYSGHCGGRTVGNEEVWGGSPLPYLRPVDCIAKGKRWGKEQYGHRVGMCQWGAHDMAKMGADFVEILCHYYGGVEVNGQGAEDEKAMLLAKIAELEAGREADRAAMVAARNTLNARLD